MTLPRTHHACSTFFREGMDPRCPIRATYPLGRRLQEEREILHKYHVEPARGLKLFAIYGFAMYGFPWRCAGSTFEGQNCGLKTKAI